jgi:hypothetical protein
VNQEMAGEAPQASGGGADRPKRPSSAGKSADGDAGEPGGGNAGTPTGGYASTPSGGSAETPSGGSTSSGGSTPSGGNAGTPSGGNAGTPSGGNAGTPSGGSTSSAGNGGTPSGGNGAGTTGGGQAEPVAGQAGAASEPQPTAGETCAACATGKCGLLDSCGQNPECSPWLRCLKACDTTQCSEACDESFADVARVYYGVYACLCDTCSAACGFAGACSKKCDDPGALPPSAVQPNTLAETGLYAPGSGPTLAPYVRPYEPQFALWADGFGKDRYVYIPPCATIDSADMDHWQFPVGTRLWKHFSVAGKLVETRVIHRYGSGTGDWLYATYGWSADKPNDPTAAVAVLHGQPNANGTQHDIPDPWECGACHGKLPDKPLGFSAIQLSHAGNGLTMQKLSDLGWLTVPARTGFSVPGTPVQRAALGYLHANCGGCHNSAGEIPRDDPMKLRLLVGQTDYDETDTVLTTIGVPTLNANADLYGKPRIDPQSAATSAIYLRMSNRDQYPMPPIATEQPDSAGGVATIKAWIDSLAK